MVSFISFCPHVFAIPSEPEPRQDRDHPPPPPGLALNPGPWLLAPNPDRGNYLSATNSDHGFPGFHGFSVSVSSVKSVVNWPFRA